MSNPLDLDAEQVCLQVSILAVLSRFTGRRINDALLAEMADVLNEEFASLRAGRRIILITDRSAINVALAPEQQDIEPARVSARRHRSASTLWRLRSQLK